MTAKPAAKLYKEFAARARVPLGFLMLGLYPWFAQPSRELFAAGMAVALVGLWLRAWACGHLDKNRTLTTTGPFAYVRNPLYLGTALVAAGFAVAGGVWWLAVLFAAFLMLVYLPVVAEEESHLRDLFPEYGDYAARVPRFLPSFSAGATAAGRFRLSLYLRNQEYNALVGFLFGAALLAWKLHR